MILSFFGGLRHSELMDLVLEKFSSTKEGVYVTHDRAKQRSDKRESRFLIPRAENPGNLDFASIVERYDYNKKYTIALLYYYIIGVLI